MNKFPTIEQTDQLKDYQEQIAHRRLPVPHPDVAFSGTAGSHTEDAAMSFFVESAHFISHASFEDVFKSITGGGAHYGVLPIENSSTGAIASVYDLLSDYRCFIVGEEKRAIIQCLMAAECATLDTLQKIYSHPQGLHKSGHLLFRGLSPVDLYSLAQYGGGCPNGF
ncbi:prephenate dehydratase domain-containing protein [Eubacterium aggregans]|uniref:prephenate dehydratase domain-containing protein n=1 Tax=Eubacterium aggregans TaxID=81409 RepID=UPI003F2F0EE8